MSTGSAEERYELVKWHAVTDALVAVGLSGSDIHNAAERRDAQEYTKMLLNLQQQDPYIVSEMTRHIGQMMRSLESYIENGKTH